VTLFGRTIGVLAVALLMSSAAPAMPVVAEQRCTGAGVNLSYEAFIAGVNAGQASVQVSRVGSTYRVVGTARSKGLWESMQQWRAEYSVTGEVTPDQQVLPGHFYSLQTTPKKRREIHIEDGVLKETKNHKVRDPRPAQRGYDLLSAVFFLRMCQAQARVHTGRDGYDFTRISAPDDSTRCSYRVVDEEGADYRLELTYQRLAEFNVPSVVSVRGPLPGRMVLADSAAMSESELAGQHAGCSAGPPLR